MKERNNAKQIVIAGLMLTLGIVIPYIFHSSSIPGNIFLPMHIPVLIGGFLLPPYLALLLGVLTPLLNSLVTGMPQLMPIGIIMVFELGAYGLFASLLFRTMKLPSVVSLVVTMIGGRIMAGFAVFILAIFFQIKLEPITYIVGAVTTGIPGILIQLFFIPTIIHGILRYTTLDLD